MKRLNAGTEEVMQEIAEMGAETHLSRLYTP